MIASPFYMRVGITDNLLGPQVQLDGKWEVAICDISLIDPSLSASGETLTTTTTSDGINRKLTKADFPSTLNPAGHLIALNFDYDFDQLVRASSSRRLNTVQCGILRHVFKLYTYGNNDKYGEQSSEFDTWCYQVKVDNFGKTGEWVMVQNSDFLNYWKDDPTKEITIYQLCVGLNAIIEKHKNIALDYINFLCDGVPEAQRQLKTLHTFTCLHLSVRMGL